MNYDEQDQVENQIENALQYLRGDESKSQHKIDKSKKTIARNISWLKENADSSYILSVDFDLSY